jgi:hypothetical protein
MKQRYPKAPRVIVEVTQDLIDNSIERDSSHCMIAEAVKLAYPAAQRVSVDLQTIRFSDPNRRLRYVYLTPRTGQLALVDFDQGTPPEPFDMRLQSGQVVPMEASSSNLQSEAALAARRMNAVKARQANEMKRASIVLRQAGTVPDRVGGKTPPTTPFARRRTFGLRGLER